MTPTIHPDIDPPVMGAVIEFEKRQAVKRMRDGMLAKPALVGKPPASTHWSYQVPARDGSATPDLTRTSRKRSTRSWSSGASTPPTA